MFWDDTSLAEVNCMDADHFIKTAPIFNMKLISEALHSVTVSDFAITNWCNIWLAIEKTIHYTVLS